MRGGVARIGANRHFKRGSSLVELALPGVKHGHVVVRLGQLGVVLGNLGEGGDGVVGLAGFGLDHALQKAHLRVFGLAGQVLVSLGLRFRVLPGAHQAGDIGVVVGPGA